MTHLLELTVTMIDGSEWYDFCQTSADTREQAIELQKSILLAGIEKAQAGNKVWASNSANYAEWFGFTLV